MEVSGGAIDVWLEIPRRPRTLAALVEHVPPLAVERLEHPVLKITRTAWAVPEAEAAKLQLERQLELSEGAWIHSALGTCNKSSY